MLPWERYSVDLDTSLDEYLAVVMETIKCLCYFIQCINTNCIVSDKIAEIKKGCEASDHIAWYMSSNGGQVELIKQKNKC